jgi:outer membrane lipoprotein-sorting protein
MLFRFLVLLIVPFTFYAQSADEVISKVQEKFDNINGFKSKFSQTIYTQLSSEAIHFDGVFKYKKGNNFAVNLPDREILSDGKTIYNYDKKNKKLVLSLYEDNNTTFSIDDIIYSYPEKCELFLLESSSNKYYIKAIPKNMELNFKEVYLTINDKYLLNKVEIVDYNNMKFIFELFNIELNPEFSSKAFFFIPTSEVKIIDLR